ncbi:hypothetical protein AFCDBAGC_5133 [Methylobacterium cerastii]|uniref:DUF3987 domain-containing protein n=1 Tax=Methylobacterium cerastii TaxID=932741 RepID=A0ABQ4QQR6_9HYPH|nr:DUF3987 domain-containing protein [Methylobacterium cerastii]GJD47240.1 hypothetical protein AFCDBAGC_5133 [Methylobacterium cerastii]
MKSDPFADELERLGPPTADDWHHPRHDPIGANGTNGTGGHGSWGETDLSLLGTGRRPAPAFPLHLLGPWAGWCERKARSASAPPDYVAVALLASVGATIANVRWPQAGAAWAEPPVLWCGEVGPPSSSKSPSMDAAFTLVRFAEDRMAYGFEEVQQEHATLKQACDARVEAWKVEVKTAVKNGDADVPPMPDNAREPPAPVRPRIRVADATVEALGALAAGLPRGLLLVRDELAGWLGAFDKYGGGGSDRAFAIEMYGGRSYVVDRMKNPEPLHIRHLSIGVLGGVQPDKLEMILNGPDDGLASRLLWAWPDTKPEFTLARGVQDDGPMQLAFARLTDLAQGVDEFGQPEPVKLRLTSEAEDRLEAFARDMVERCHEASGLLAGTLGKARGHALRLSAVLEHLWWCGGAPSVAEPREISPAAVTAAADLLNAYFLPMAERVFGDASIPVVERRGMLLARHLRQNRIGEFNARDVRRQVGGMLRDAADMEAACKQLLEANLIRQRFARAGERKGRKAQNYEVHPEVLANRPFAETPILRKMGPPVPIVPLAPIAPKTELSAPKAQTAQGGKIFSEGASDQASGDHMAAVYDLRPQR